jgi:hypothetical protein
MSERIRYVLDDPRGESVCLNDVVKAYIRASEKIRHLEYKNSAHSLREAKRVMREAKKVAAEFEVRLKNEITTDVMTELSKIDKRVDLKNLKNSKKFFE